MQLNTSLVVATLMLHVKFKRISRCNHNVFNFEKLKDLTFVHEYTVTVSNWIKMLGALEDPVELCDTFKRKTLESTKWCIGERPRSQGGLVLVETLDNIEKSRTARLAGNQDKYGALSSSAISLLRRDKERSIKSCHRGC